MLRSFDGARRIDQRRRAVAAGGLSHHHWLLSEISIDQCARRMQSHPFVVRPRAAMPPR